jgi:hypothetical protein
VIGQFLPAELQTALSGRTNPNLPWQMFGYMPDDRETFTDVMTYNITTGFEGSIPGTDWTWEAFVNHGESHTYAAADRHLLARADPVGADAPGRSARGLALQGNQETGGFGASTGPVHHRAQLLRRAAGGFSKDCLEAIRADLKNRSKMRQTIAEATCRAACSPCRPGDIRLRSAQLREQDYEFLNDTLTTQGRSYLDQALGIYPSGDAAVRSTPRKSTASC